MKLMGKYLKEALRDMEKNHVRFCFFGDLSRLTPDLQKLCRETQERSAGYEGVQVNFCFNYGGRDEIVRGVREIARLVQSGQISPEMITEDTITDHLDSVGVPDPELVIRPSGEMRVSNFLPWQTVYSEFVFMNVLWPDFSPADLDAAIEEYHRRNRRFGGA